MRKKTARCTVEKKKKVNLDLAVTTVILCLEKDRVELDADIVYNSR